MLSYILLYRAPAASNMPTTATSGVDNTKHSRGGIIDAIISVHVIISFAGNTLSFGLFFGVCQIGYEIGS